MCVECGRDATQVTPGCVFCAQRAIWGFVDARQGIPEVLRILTLALATITMDGPTNHSARDP